MRINHSDLDTARTISLAELSVLLPECAAVLSTCHQRPDPGCRQPRSQWEELGALWWLDPGDDESLPF